MSDQPTYEELVLRCQRLANIIVRNNNATEEIIRAEVKKAKDQAWDEGFFDGRRQDAEGDDGPRFVNPYKEQTK